MTAPLDPVAYSTMRAAWLAADEARSATSAAWWTVATTATAAVLNTAVLVTVWLYGVLESAGARRRRIIADALGNTAT